MMRIVSCPKHLLAVAPICLLGSIFIAYLLWNPGPASTAKFDKKSNGIWAGRQWYTGRKVHNGDSVSLPERDAFIHELRMHGITYVFVHAGPIRSDGTIAEMPGKYFNELQDAAPEIRFLPWIGGDVRKYALENNAWRAALITTIWSMKKCGAKGVHLDIEPIRTWHPGYLSLLTELKKTIEVPFIISHATRRVAPINLPIARIASHFWSEQFYDACMSTTDQTVLMGYDTCIRSRKIYTMYIRLQTAILLQRAFRHPGHSLMIGIPSYGDNPKLSSPRVENIPAAVSGIRAALEREKGIVTSFDGVAIYSHWTTDTKEWHWFEVFWMQRY